MACRVISAALFSLLALVEGSPARAAQIAQFSPQGTVSVVESVKVTFDAPVIAFGDGQAPPPVRVACDDDSVQGQGRWTDARRWTYDFSGMLGPGIHCQAKVDPAFHALDGAALRGKTAFSFSTGGPHVVDSRPYGAAIDEEQVFVLRFNGKVAPDTLQAAASCMVEGLGEAVPVRLIDDASQRDEILEANYFPDDWRDESVQLLQCKRRLPAQAKVRLVVGKNVATPSGVASTQSQSFDYTVRPPFKATFSCQRENANAACTPVLPIRLGFNAPVPSDLADAIRVVTPEGEKKPAPPDEYETRGSVDGVRFEGPFPEQSDVRVVLPEGLKDDAGRPLSNADQFPMSVRMAANPALVKFSSGTFGVVERFANVPQGGDEDDYPASVPLTVRNVEAALQAGDLPVASGKVRDYAPENDADVLHWYARLQRLDDGQWTPAQLQRIMAGRAPGRGGEDAADVRGFSMLSGRGQVRTLNLPSAGQDGARPLEVIGVPIVEPGFHVLEVESASLGQALLGSGKPMYVRSGALVTNLGVHLKRGRDDVLAWVTTLDEGKVVPGAQINVLSCSGELLARGTTDDDGVWHGAQALDAPSYCESTGLSGVYVSARIAADHPMARGKADFSFVLSSWNDGIEPWRFNVPTDTRAEPTVVTHTVFDRSLFRAGETVSMKHFVRMQTRQGLALPDKSKLPDKVVVTHQGSGQSQELPLHWQRTPSGGLSAQSTLQLSRGAKLGVYTVMLQRGDRYAQADGEFRVEEFKLPVLAGSLKISAGDGAAPLVAPRRLNADVQVSYVSGGPAGRLPVSLSGVVRDKWLHFPDYDDYSFDAPAAAAQGDDEEAPQGEGQTLFLDKKPVVLDGQGGARLEVGAVPAVTRPRELLFEASFSDPNGLVQTLSQTVAVWPAAVQAGIRAGSWTQQGSQTSISSVALSPSGKPQPGVSMSIRAVSRSTYSTRKRMVGGFYSYDNQTRTRDLGQLCSGTTDARGILRCDVSLDQSGSIELIAAARDSQGRESLAASTVWVVGGQELWFGGNNDDRIDVIPGKKVYAPGETAELQVRMPFREATALVSVEREGVLSARVVPLQGKDPRIELPVQAQWGPNVYVSVLALRGRLREVPWYSFFTWGWKQPRAWLGAYRSAGAQYEAPTALVDLSKPAFRFGLAEIRVSGQQDRLDVKVSPEHPRYPVRGKAQVTVQVATPDGKPAANGQVAFAAVDQALLELAPNDSWDLLAAMRQRRSYGVQTATAQMQVVGRRHYGRKALPAGGGGGASPTRELLDTLLFWKPDVQLDGQGRAQLTVPLNDAISAFRLVAIADYGPARFGMGSATIATTQDVQLISGLPALVREGDRYEAALTVRNTTGHDMRIRVQASYSGSEAPGASLPPQTVRVAAGQAQLVGWDIAVPETNSPDPSSELEWHLQAREMAEGAAPERAPAGGTGAPASDSLRVRQTVFPAVPVAARQSTLLALGADAPIRLPVSVPEGALTGADGRARGGLDIYLQSSLTGGLPGVRDWFAAYPYTCLEQLSAKAIGMRSARQWQAVLDNLPDYLDGDGLAGYFPGPRQGSEVLTAYLLAATDEARAMGLGFDIPADVRKRMSVGLLAFVQGRIARNRWAPRDDLDARKLMALEALSREGQVKPRLLDSIDIAPDRWPTSAVIDWMSILQRVPDIPQRDARLAQASQVIQGRLLSRGEELVFAQDAQDSWWWLMNSPQVDAARLMLVVAGRADWDEDMPRLARGLMMRQRDGAWRTTAENLMASLALEKFSRVYEREPIAGRTRVALGSSAQAKVFDWPARGAAPGPRQREGSASRVKAPSNAVLLHDFQPWPQGGGGTLTIAHEGTGTGWASVRSLAAVPVDKPIAAGYQLKREVTAVSQAHAGVWTRGDVYRVRLTVTAKAPTAWAVLNDPVPAGATILGSGLGRDSAIAAQSGGGDTQGVEPSYVERAFEGVRAYYEYLPQGVTQMEYTVRLNAAGAFNLPPSRVEALYQPDVYGVAPHAGVFAVRGE